MSWERTDYDDMSRVYDAGRAMPEEWVGEWREVLNEYLDGTPGPVADVGSGTGIWASFIAKWLEVAVIGIEPSAGMRQRAVRDRSDPRITYLGADAEHVPLRDDSCEAVWMSTVVHHIPDLAAAAREARRVLRDGRPLLIRQPFSGRHDQILWAQVFPAALEIAEQRHPRSEAVVRTFEDEGFKWERTRRVTETSAADLHEYARKVETRADSTLRLISDQDFRAGLEKLRRMADESAPGPVTATLDLVVLR